jgi:tetratricopeptide (TPR) repeat protein
MSFYADEMPDEPHIARAKECLRQKQPSEAAAAIRHRLNFCPGTALDYELLGVALAQAGDNEHAVAALEQAEKMNSHEATIPYDLGLVYRRAGRTADAVAAFKRALALKPDYEAARRAIQATDPKAGVARAASGPVRCPHCGMETRTHVSCEWCSHPLAPPPGAAAVAPAAHAPAAGPASGGGLFGRLARKLHR